MATDIKLDAEDGTWVVVQSNVLQSTASDFLLDSPGRRTESSGLRRALVHDGRDGLTINFNGDYPGGVTVGGDLRIAGRLLLPDDPVGDNANVLVELRSDVAQLKRTALLIYPERIEQIEQSIASLAALLDAVVVPAWRTQEEVEQGDDMGVLFMPASVLGLLVEYIVWQSEPGLNHGEVIRIEPPPGTVVRRGSTIKITINLEG